MQTLDMSEITSTTTTTTTITTTTTKELIEERYEQDHIKIAVAFESHELFNIFENVYNNCQIRQEGFQLLNAEPTQLKYWSPKAVPRSSIPILPFPISSIARPQNFADAAFEKTYCEQFQASSDFQSKNLIAMPGKLAFKKP